MIRRRHLPWTWYSSGGNCDERIGRYCLTYSDDDGDEDDWRPPPDPEPVKRARARLLEHLDGAAARVPGDSWIAGQRIRYHLEAGQQPEALRAAGECRAARWWCLALAGYVRHLSEDFVAADSLFDAALAAMPAKQRREWSDLSVLLGDGDWRAYRRAEGAMRDSLDRRLWWLADPLWTTPGNERRTEHFARHVIDELQDRARSTEGSSWGYDLRELLIRYGWPVGWERMRTPVPSQGTPPMIGHYASRARRFIPPAKALADPTGVSPDDWSVKVKRARSEFSPSYAAWSDSLQHQLAVFRRSDSLLLVAAYDLAADTAARGPVDAALIAAPDERTAPRIAQRPGGGLTGALQLVAPPAPTVLSLEVLARGDSARASRARFGFRPPAPAPGFALSDILLLGAANPLPRELDGAAQVARGSTRVRSRERVGLFWEVYGVPEGTETLQVSVRLTRDGRDWLRRTRTPVELSWQDQVAARPILGRSLLLELPELPPGRYTLEVAVAPEGGQRATSSRVLEVSGPS